MFSWISLNYLLGRFRGSVSSQLHMCVCACVQVCVTVCVCMRAGVCHSVCVHACRCVSQCVCACVQVCVTVCVCECVHVSTLSHVFEEKTSPKPSNPRHRLLQHSPSPPPHPLDLWAALQLAAILAADGNVRRCAVPCRVAYCCQTAFCSLSANRCVP